MAEATLSDIKEQLIYAADEQKDTKLEVRDLNKKFGLWVQTQNRLLDRQKLADLERSRELKKMSPGRPSGGVSSGGDEISGFGDLLGTALLLPLQAITKAFAGIKAIPSMIGGLVVMLRNIRNSFLNLEIISNGPVGKIISATKDLLSRGAQILSPLFSPIKNIFQSAINMMEGPFQSLITTTKDLFSRGADIFGAVFRPIKNTFDAARDLMKGPLKVLLITTKVLMSIGETILTPIFSPIRDIFRAATNLSQGNLGKILRFFTGGVAEIGTLFGRLLWPLNTIFGVVEGVREFRETEGTLYDKLSAGIGGFLGEIVGAPYDLLKNVINWILKKSFGIEVDDQGNAIPGQGLPGWVVTKLNTFSFRETIDSIVDGIFSIVKDSVEWVKLLFTDPVQALKNLWDGYVGVWVGIGNWIFDNTLKPAWDWISGLFKWNSEDEERGDTNLISNIFNQTIDKIETFFKNLFDFIPSFEEIKQRIQSLLPAFMQPETIEQERARLQEELVDLKQALENLEPGTWGYSKMKTSLETDIAELERLLATLPEMKSGGIFNAAMSGSPVMLHGQEAVIPLDSTQGQQILSEKAPFGINRNNRGRELYAKSAEVFDMTRAPGALAYTPIVNAPSTSVQNNQSNFVSSGFVPSFDMTYEPR